MLFLHQGAVFSSLLFGLLLTALPAAQNELAAPWIRGVFTGNSPRPVVASATKAWQSATTLADNTDRAFVLIGSGDSMQPLYQPGTILVLQQVPYESLRPGQTVLYRNQRNKVVAHVLITKARDGWRAQGLNNPTHDMEPVVADNLVGIIIAAFQPPASAAPLVVAANATHSPAKRRQ